MVRSHSSHGIGTSSPELAVSSEEQACTGMMGKGTQSTLLRAAIVIRRPLLQTPSSAGPLPRFGHGAQLPFDF